MARVSLGRSLLVLCLLSTWLRETQSAFSACTSTLLLSPLVRTPARHLSSSSASQHGLCQKAWHLVIYQFLAPTFSLLLLFSFSHMIRQWNISKDVLPIHQAALASYNWNNIPCLSSTLKIKGPSKHLSTQAGCPASRSVNMLLSPESQKKRQIKPFCLSKATRKEKYFHDGCIQNVQIGMDTCWILYPASFYKKDQKVSLLLEKLSKKHLRFVQPNYSNNPKDDAGIPISSEPSHLPTYVPLERSAKWGTKDTKYINYDFKKYKVWKLAELIYNNHYL